MRVLAVLGVLLLVACGPEVLTADLANPPSCPKDFAEIFSGSACPEAGLSCGYTSSRVHGCGAGATDRVGLTCWAPPTPDAGTQWSLDRCL